MKAATAYRKAARLLMDPARWIKGVSASDAGGTRTYAADPLAVCWCVGGALEKIDEDAWWSAPYEIVAFNDDPDTAHADVVTALLFLAEAAVDE